MATFLGQHLVFHLNGRGTCVFKLTDRPHNVQNFAISGIAINNQRQLRRPVDCADDEAKVIQRNNPKVWQRHRGRYGGT